MKKIILLLVVAFFALNFSSCSTTNSLPFAGKTKHKPIKYMKKKEIKKAKQGKNMYHYRNGKLIRR